MNVKSDWNELYKSPSPGGPLFLVGKSGRYDQVGVVSWSNGIGITGTPGEEPTFYAKLSHFLVWIARKTRKSTYCAGE